MTDLVDKLITGGTTGNSDSTAGGGSSSSSEGFTVDPSDRGEDFEMKKGTVGGYVQWADRCRSVRNRDKIRTYRQIGRCNY